MLFHALINFYWVIIQASIGKCKNAISGPNQHLLSHYSGQGWTDPKCLAWLLFGILTLYIPCTWAVRCSRMLPCSSVCFLRLSWPRAARGLEFAKFSISTNFKFSAARVTPAHWAFRDRDFFGERHFWSVHPWFRPWLENVERLFQALINFYFVIIQAIQIKFDTFLSKCQIRLWVLMFGAT